MEAEKNIVIAETQIRYFVIEPKDIVWIKAILESYEGMVVLRTVDIKQPVIELLIAPDFAAALNPVIEEIAAQVKLEEIPSPESWVPLPP
jgi:hypothetical protein